MFLKFLKDPKKAYFLLFFAWIIKKGYISWIGKSS